MLGLVAACGGGGEATGGVGEGAAPAPRPDDGTTTSAAPTPPSPIAPLTGEPVPEPVTRPALVVKIDNDPKARPQIGLNQADLVYEVRVEGITRFAAVFHSTDAEPVGPIRSARSSDIDLMTNLSRPLFAWSGGNPTVTGEVTGAQDRGLLTNVSHDASSGDYRRDSSRAAPHNLYSSTSGLWTHATPDALPPREVLRHRIDGESLPASAAEVPGVSVDYGSTRIPSVEFVWDGSVGGWRRFQVDALHPVADSAHVDALGQQVAPANVVILFVDYTTSVAGGGSPQAITVAEGDAVVLSDGKMVAGRWQRLNPNEPVKLTDMAGEEIGLTPGRSWVLLPEAGTSRLLTREQADGLMAVAR
jgi:hypothetical protein